MTTFDFNQVREFADGINARLDECENGEGMQCYSLDATMTFCAERCCEFAVELRKWGRGVFSGKVAFDEVAEQLWKAELLRLYRRGLSLFEQGRQAEDVCFVLEGQSKLAVSLFTLHKLLSPWVTPKLAVGPSPRQGYLGDRFFNEAKEQLSTLPPLPSEWKPVDPSQMVRLRKLPSDR